MSEYGLRARDRVAYVTLKGSADSRDYQLPLRMFQAVGLHRRTVIDSRLPIAEVVRRLRNVEPDVIVGYAGALARISAAMTEEGREFIRPRFIVAGAEVLTAPMRQQIEAAFAVPVYDVYGAHEFNLLAWQCSDSRSFHTCDDAVIVEVLKDGRPAGPGERGEVVATGLHSFAMPFIRYRLGDVVTKGDETCRCGQPFSTIESIQGRTYVSFPLPGERSIYSFELWSIIRAAAAWIGVYQLVQQRLDRFVLRIVPRERPVEAELTGLTETLRTTLGPGVELEVQLVPTFRQTPTGSSARSAPLQEKVLSKSENKKSPVDVGQSGEGAKVEWAIVAGFVLLALILRLYLSTFKPSVEWDGFYYALLGKNLISGDFAKGLSTYWSPLYPALIGLASLIFGDLKFAGTFVSIVAGSLLVVPVYLLVLDFYGRRAALCSALLVAVCPALADYSTDILTEATYTLLFMFGILAGWFALSRGKNIYYLLTGLVFGACYLTRPEAFAYIILMLILTLGHKLLHRQLRSRKTVVNVATLLAGFLLLSLPYLIFLHRQTNGC